MLETVKRKVESGVVYSPVQKELPCEFFAIQNNIEVYRKLFRLKYLDGLRGHHLAAMFDFKDKTELDASGLEAVLEGWLAYVMGGIFRQDRLGFICPDCLTLAVRSVSKDGGDGIRLTCSDCGLELEPEIDMETLDISLDRDVTFSPTSPISSNGGKGCTFNPNSDREHQNFLWGVVNSDNILFSDFKKSFPEIAGQFHADPNEADCFELVWSGEQGLVYCRTGPFIRKVTIDAYFGAVGKLFHKFDAPYRKQQTLLAIEPKGEQKRAKEIALSLLRKYGFDSTDHDQAIYNSVGRDIARFRPFVDARARHVSEKAFAETIVYYNALRFDKKGIITLRMKQELLINGGLIKFIDGVIELLSLGTCDETVDVLALSVMEKAHRNRLNP